jgi:cytochrome o ubiquinol oxidase subunit 2
MRRIHALLAIPTATVPLSGCGLGVLDPKGRIASDEKSLIITATLLMLLVVIPVIFMTLSFAWKYRESNTGATFTPDWSYSHRIELAVWSVPVAIILVLGTITWKTTHSLDPYRPLDSTVKPITIDVIALDWKWLFIYPGQRIASVNEVVFPANTPVSFRVTSDTVMNVFFIPQLGSQIYAMAGMQTQVNLIADAPGVFDGLSANFSGAGFPDMTFEARATSAQEFNAWVAKVQAAPRHLGIDNYADLARPSQKDAVQYFSGVQPLLYTAVLDKYMGKSSGMKLAEQICLPKPVASVATSRPLDPVERSR